MATKSRIRRRFQVTIPQEIRDQCSLKEGQYVNFEVTPKGIIMTVAPEIDPEQAWFWSPRWAETERKADEDFRVGKVVEADSAEEAIDRLKGKNKPRR